jgi:hypothetical protein
MRIRTTDTMPLPICGDPEPADGSPDPRFDRRVRSALANARERKASVADLRQMIVSARPQIIEAGTDTQGRMELSHELRAILAALEPDRPDLVAVRDRWKRVRGLLGPAAGTGRVAQVTDLLIVLLRAR